MGLFFFLSRFGFVVFRDLFFRGETTPDGDDEVDGEDAQHCAGGGEGSFGLGAVEEVLGVVRDGAGFGNVPGWAILGVFGIGGVGGGLVVEGNGVEGDQDGVEEDREDRWEDVEEVHD